MSNKDKENAKDQEFKRNRKQNKSDNRAHHAQPTHDNPDLKSQLSAQEQHFLAHLDRESQHMSSLADHDGKGKSPLANYDHRVRDVDEQDQNSPDNWIPRSQELIRLTGTHPLNAEPNMTALFRAGLVTPNKLHYVRNHGAVPRLDWETHRIHIYTDCDALLSEAVRQDLPGQFDEDYAGGRVLNMTQLSELEWINIPVALACDGNRRKELNMLKRSKGFNWAAGGVSNSYWKGPTLVAVLAAAGFTKDSMTRKIGHNRMHVHFEGADELSEGKYATSIPLSHALDPCNDVLLAQFMNDVPLAPDHGYPVRLIIPGFVGGRCVKWLEKIWISEKPSQNHYHIWDNRVLPSFVTEKDGPFARTMFHHPSTACMEQNLNSVIAIPAHGEEIDLGDPANMKPGSTYRLEGYAYDGGGHEVQKVEVSIDGGKEWLYAYRVFPANALRHGWKFWTWCHWYCDVDKSALLRAPEICVRAWNVFKNTQPEQPTWNIMGMMNNCIYRVRPGIRQVPVFPDDKDGMKKNVLAFLHPCAAANDDSGWMKPSIEIQLNEAKQQAASPTKQFTREEVEKHNTEEDCWIVVNDKVYDATSVLDWHPGGAHAILGLSGKVTTEVSEQYNAIHDDFANHKLQECVIGVLTAKAQQTIKKQADERARELAKSGSDENVVLKKHAWTSVTLAAKEELSKDSRKYRFEFVEKDKRLGLATGKHVLLGFHFEDKLVFRAYTPTRPVLLEEEDGSFDLVVKTYFPSDKDPGGTISNVLDCIEIGEHVDIKGPTGDIEYCGNGRFNIEGKDHGFGTIHLVGGGSGVTPHYQLIHRILKSSEDRTKIQFIYANSNEDNILMKQELDDLAQANPDQFRLIHVLSHPSHDWHGEKGHVDKEKFEKHFVVPEQKSGKGVRDSAVFLCGPPPMIKAAHGALEELGFEDEKTMFAY